MPSTNYISKVLCLGFLAAFTATPIQAEEPVEIEADLVVRGRIRRPQVFFLIPKANISPLEKGVIRQDAIGEIIGLAGTAPLAAPRPYGQGLLTKSMRQAYEDHTQTHSGVARSGATGLDQ